MEYTIDKTLLKALVDEEVSKVADEAYAENGVSLYDSVILTEKDDNAVGRFIDEAVNGFAARTFDISKFVSTDTLGTTKLLFYVPDFDDTMAASVESEITHYIVFSVCMDLFKSRRAQAVPEYEARALSSINKAVTLLKSRKSPLDVW